MIVYLTDAELQLIQFGLSKLKESHGPSTVNDIEKLASTLQKQKPEIKTYKELPPELIVLVEKSIYLIQEDKGGNLKEYLISFEPDEQYWEIELSMKLDAGYFERATESDVEYPTQYYQTWKEVVKFFKKPRF